MLLKENYYKKLKNKIYMKLLKKIFQINKLYLNQKFLQKLKCYMINHIILKVFHFLKVLNYIINKKKGKIHQKMMMKKIYQIQMLIN